MKINKFPFIVLLSLILVSCSPVSTQSPNVTVTSEVTVTSAPTKTPAPTETPNPLAEAPKGTNGIDSDGLFIKTENGFPYTWDAERNAWFREYFYGSMWDKAESANKFLKDQLFTTVLIDDAIDGEDLLAKLTPHKNVDAENAFNWTKNFQNVLFKQMGLVGMFPDPNNFDTNPWYDGSHAFHFDFKNADGVQQWGLWEGTTITVHIRGDYEKLKAEMEINRFSETKSLPSYGVANNYMVKIWTENGNLFVDIAPSLRPASVWTEKQILEMFMLGPAVIMENATYITDSQDSTQLPDISNPQSGSLLSIFVMNQDKYKLFDLEPSP